MKIEVISAVLLIVLSQKVQSFEPEKDVRFIWMDKGSKTYDEGTKFTLEEIGNLSPAGFSRIKYDKPIIFIIHGFTEGPEVSHYIRLIEYVLN